MDEQLQQDLREALESLRRCMATDPRDWALSRRDAWMFAIVLGWGPDPDDEPGDNAWAELTEKHGWDAETVTRLQRYGAAVERFLEG